MNRSRLARAFGLGLALLAPPALAQDLIGSYSAYIGEYDLYNSKGVRLSHPWQVLRQDRANYHRFGIAQAGDEWDAFFGSMDNRAAMERMIRNGYIDPGAAAILTRGGALVHVRIYGQGNVGQSIQVSVGP